MRHRLFLEDKPVCHQGATSCPPAHGWRSVINSMVADGCIINGTVEHSVLFRGVKIDKGAHVKNCIIMQDCHVEEGVQLRTAFDTGRHQDDGRLIGPSAHPIVISKNMII